MITVPRERSSGMQATASLHADATLAIRLRAALLFSPSKVRATLSFPQQGQTPAEQRAIPVLLLRDESERGVAVVSGPPQRRSISLREKLGNPITGLLEQTT